MPNKRTHDTITKVIGLVALPIVGIASGAIEVVAFEIGVLITLKVSPDLDIHNSLGWLGELMGFSIYKKLAPHRGGLSRSHWAHGFLWQAFMFSHIPILGTSIRWVMVMLPILSILMTFSAMEMFPVRLGLFVLAGMSFSDTFHLLADMFMGDMGRGRKAIYGKRKKRMARPGGGRAIARRRGNKR